MAVRGTDGRLLILADHPDEYTAAQWLQRDGDRRKVAQARSNAHCDPTGCIATAKDGHVVALSLKAGALVEDCGRANVLIAAIPVRRRCTSPQLVLNRFDIAKNGATTLTFEKDEIKIETVAAERGNRPWSKHGSARSSAGSRNTFFNSRVTGAGEKRSQ